LGSIATFCFDFSSRFVPLDDVLGSDILNIQLLGPLLDGLVLFEVSGDDILSLPLLNIIV